MGRSHVSNLVPIGVVTLVAAAAAAFACGGHGDTPSTVDAAPELEGPADGSSPPLGFDAASQADAGVVCTTVPCVVGLTAGGRHTCARLSDGTVRCWGNDTTGQLGVGLLDDGGFEGTPLPTPQPVTGLGGAAQISASGPASEQHMTCARLEDAAVDCWGDNRSGHLGQGEAAPQDTLPHPTPLRVSVEASRVDVGPTTACAVTPSGGMWCWGLNSAGQLGRTLATGETSSPVPAPVQLPSGTTVTAGATGSQHTCALTTGGEVLCWGAGGNGRLGRDAPSVDPVPAPVPGLTGVTSVATARDYTCAVRAGKIVCWGSLPADAGATTAPVEVPMPGGATALQVSTSAHHACAVLDGGSVACWGQNLWGECGMRMLDDGTPDLSVAQPALVEGAEGVVEVQVGGASNPVNAPGHSCARLRDGRMVCWGANTDGQLGRGLVDGGAGDLSSHPFPGPVAF